MVWRRKAVADEFVWIPFEVLVMHNSRLVWKFGRAIERKTQVYSRSKMAAVHHIGKPGKKHMPSSVAIGEAKMRRPKVDIHQTRESMDAKEDAVAVDMLQPGMVIRPQLDVDQARQLVDELYGLTVTSIKELNSYDDRNFFVQVSSEHRNAYLAETGLWPHGYTLKVLNSMDSQKNHVDAEHEMQAILHSADIMCPRPVTNLQGQVKLLKKNASPVNNNPTITNNNEATVESYGMHIVRLMQYIPGRIVTEVPYTPKLMYDIGKHIALIQEALEGFHHPALSGYSTIWDLASVPRLMDFTHAILSEEHKQLIFDIIRVFNEEVVPVSEQLPKGVIHGDFNDQNIIVEAVPSCPGGMKKVGVAEEYRFSGVIDFGDSSESCYVYDVAITIMYMMLESTIVAPTSAGGHVLAGYLAHRSLTEQEFNVLKVCVAGRFAQSLTMGAYNISQDPGNEHLLVAAKNGWPRLKELWAMPKEVLYSKWRSIMKSYAAA